MGTLSNAVVDGQLSATNESFATRMAVLKQLAKENGIRLPNTIIPEGESLIPYGEDRQRALKEEIDSLPGIGEAAKVIRAVRLEQDPQETKVPVQRVRMEKVNGGLYGLGSDPSKAVGYSQVAFGQACQELKPSTVHSGFASTLAALPPSIRADAFNHFAENRAGEKDVVLRTARVPQYRGGQLVLRRSLQAVVSERYTVVEDHDLLDDLQAVLPEGAKVRYTTTDSRSDVEIIWPAMSRQLKVGDIALIALHVGNSQTKQASLRIAAKLLRVLCLNFTTAWGENDGEDISIVHMGEARAKFAAAVKRALAVVEPFVIAFGDAYQVQLPVSAPTRGEIAGKVVKAFALPARFGDAVTGAWDMDREKGAGDTLAGLVNAMTRASQEMTLERAGVVEAAAGRLVMQGWEALN